VRIVNGFTPTLPAFGEEAIGNPDEAIAAWKEALATNSGSLVALRALDRLFVQKGLDLELADKPAATA